MIITADITLSAVSSNIVTEYSTVHAVVASTHEHTSLLYYTDSALCFKRRITPLLYELDCSILIIFDQHIPEGLK